MKFSSRPQNSHDLFHIFGARHLLLANNSCCPLCCNYVSLPPPCLTPMSTYIPSPQPPQSSNHHVYCHFSLLKAKSRTNRKNYKWTNGNRCARCCQRYNKDWIIRLSLLYHNLVSAPFHLITQRLRRQSKSRTPRAEHHINFHLSRGRLYKLRP